MALSILTLKYPHSRWVVVDSASCPQCSGDDRRRWDQIVGESVVEVTLQLENILDLLELLLVPAYSHMVSPSISHSTPVNIRSGWWCDRQCLRQFELFPRHCSHCAASEAPGRVSYLAVNSSKLSSWCGSWGSSAGDAASLLLAEENGAAAVVGLKTGDTTKLRTGRAAKNRARDMRASTADDIGSGDGVGGGWSKCCRRCLGTFQCDS